MKYNDEFYISLIGEAFDGYSEFSFKEKPIFIKHVNIKDQRYLQKYYEKYKKLAIAKGLETNEERIKTIKEDGMWSDEDDAKISTLKFETDNLKKTIKSLPLRSQREKLQLDIDTKLKTLDKYKRNRKEIIGKTAEDYATQRSSDEILRFLLFKDEELTEHFFNEEEFSELETWEVLNLGDIQLKISEKINDLRIQEAVLRPFFNMYLSFCDDPNAFYHKPVTHLTIYQMRVLLYGKIFYNIFQHVEDIPDSIKEDPEKLMAFSEAQRNKGGSKDLVRDDAAGSVLFGATNEDVKDLDGVSGGVSLSDQIEKHGGKLDMKQMMRLAGHDV